MLKITDAEFNSLVEAGFLPWRILSFRFESGESLLDVIDRKTLNRFLKIDMDTLDKLKVHWNLLEIMWMCEVPRLIPWVKKQSIDTLNLIGYFKWHDIKEVVDWVGVNHLMDFYTQAGKIDFLFMGINPIFGLDAVFITALKSFSMDKIRGMYRNMSRMQIVDYIKGNA
jgi:hypothetical protein